MDFFFLFCTFLRIQEHCVLLHELNHQRLTNKTFYHRQTITKMQDNICAALLSNFFWIFFYFTIYFSMDRGGRVVGAAHAQCLSFILYWWLLLTSQVHHEFHSEVAKPFFRFWENWATPHLLLSIIIILYVCTYYCSIFSTEWIS